MLKNLSLYVYGLGETVSALETFEWILNSVSRSIFWSLFNCKSIKLGQMATLNMTFLVVVSVYRVVKI